MINSSIILIGIFISTTLLTNSVFFSLLSLIVCKILYPQLNSKIKLYYKSSPLAEKILSKCPSITSRYFPTPWLFDFHLQMGFGSTIGSRSGKSILCEEVKYTREILTLPDGGIISIDWTFEKNISPKNKILIFVPGIGASSQSQSSRCIAIEGKKTGYRVAIVHGRGICSKIKVISKLAPCIYTAVSWKDFAFAIEKIHEKFPEAPIVGIGASMGGINLCKYAANTGDKCLLKALVILAVVYDIKKYSLWVKNKWNSFGVISKLLTAKMKNFVINNWKFLEKWSPELKQRNIDYDTVMASTCTYDFDNNFTAKMVLLKNADEYYHEGSIYYEIDRIKIPMLSLSSLDDPLNPSDTIPKNEFRKNSNTILAVTTTGGHLGWFTGFFIPQRWYPKPCLEYLEAVLNNTL